MGEYKIDWEDVHKQVIPYPELELADTFQKASMD